MPFYWYHSRGERHISTQLLGFLFYLRNAGGCLHKIAHTGSSELGGSAKDTLAHQTDLLQDSNLRKKHSKFSNHALTPTKETEFVFWFQGNKPNSLISWRVLKINSARPLVPGSGKVGKQCSPRKIKQNKSLGWRHRAIFLFLFAEHRAEVMVVWVNPFLFPGGSLICKINTVPSTGLEQVACLLSHPFPTAHHSQGRSTPPDLPLLMSLFGVICSPMRRGTQWSDSALHLSLTLHKSHLKKRFIHVFPTAIQLLQSPSQSVPEWARSGLEWEQGNEESLDCPAPW